MRPPVPPFTEQTARQKVQAAEDAWNTRDPERVAAVRGAAEALGYPHQDIISGAGHDAVYMARVAPTAMIFVPCVGGISHNEVEDAKPDDLTAGCAVLLNAMLEAADRPT